MKTEDYINAVAYEGDDVVSVVNGILGEQTQTMTKRQAGFVKAANTNFCKECMNYVLPNSCRIVAGVVWPYSTCQYFKRK